MRFTIETREITNNSGARNLDLESRNLTVEASDANEAISKFINEESSELVSFHGRQGRESIATVRKEDSVFLVRVYND